MPDNTNRPKDPPEVNVPYTLEELRTVAPLLLAGHSGDCAKVLHATVSGKTDAECSCGASNTGASA